MRFALIALLVLTVLLAGAPSAAEAATNRRDCGPVALTAVEAVVVTTISATCATAVRVARRWGRKESCRDSRCRVRSWICRPRGAKSRCARAERPRQALLLQRRMVIVD